MTSELTKLGLDGLSLIVGEGLGSGDSQRVPPCRVSWDGQSIVAVESLDVVQRCVAVVPWR
jgi:hypothetical protein